MDIYFEDEIQAGSAEKEKMSSAAERAVMLEGLPIEAIEISVTFVTKERIQELNREFRSKDVPTDVLSFPQYEPDELEFYADNPEECPDELVLGDVVICREKAEEQAEEFGHSMERELIYLFTHSVLHLLGYDHIDDEDKRAMRQREEEIMDYLGIPRRQL